LITIKPILIKTLYTKKKQNEISMKKIVFVALAIGFILFGVDAYLQSRPAPKNERIYKEIKQFSPYYLDKRFGGLQIMSKADKEFKEKPSNMEVFHRLEYLEKKWGSTHLKLESDVLIIHNNAGEILKKMTLQNEDEIQFIHTFYGI
jgi:hypothetical protein